MRVVSAHDGEGESDIGDRAADRADDLEAPTRGYTAVVDAEHASSATGSTFAHDRIVGQRRRVAFPRQASTAEDIMTRAETALAEAKHAGRDCFAAYRLTEPQRNRHRDSMAIAERVQRALKEVHPSTRAWFETARNFVLFANDGGLYDDLMTYMRSKKLL